MNPEQYEHHVAAVLTAEGWATTVSQMSGDLGIDMIGERPGRRVAVQAKMYGGSATKINAEQIMCLHGAAAYAGCDEMMIATDGNLTPQAQRVADKLGIVVRRIEGGALSDDPRAPNTEVAPHAATGHPSFGTIWEQRVRPMMGTGVPRATGAQMQLAAVDGSGVRRVTSKGDKQLIPIDVFRWAVQRLLVGEVLTRQAIRDRHAGRFSSAVIDILVAILEFEATTQAGLRAVRLRPGS